jgi:hypothetical protein
MRLLSRTAVASRLKDVNEQADTLLNYSASLSRCMQSVFAFRAIAISAFGS